jgi:dihydroorotate dehydrogenase
MKSTYDINKTYDENYDQGPFFDGKVLKLKSPKQKIKILDFELNSPLGVPAGPLLNSNYIKLYAELGFDLPVYKTVRTDYRLVHPAPNCVYVDADGQLTSDRIGGDLFQKQDLPKDLSEITITNSFGMPSKSVAEWQADVELANSYLKEGQVMPVSITGTPGEGVDLIEDYARCATMAVEAGAKIIEANFSCPNVDTGEGAIFCDPESSSKISKKIREAIGNTPLFIKVGFFGNQEILRSVAAANAPFIDGIAGINTITMNVYKENGEQALLGKSRLKSGLCGAGIRDLSMKFTRNLAQIKEDGNYDFVICGVGGITTAEDFFDRLEAGADIAMSATGAMWNPLLALEFHKKYGKS